MSTTNPISDRIDELHDQWVSFAENPDARILVWQARADEEPLIEAFVAKENDDSSAETPDLFLRLVTSFTNPPAHGYLLREELISYYDQVRDDLRADGLDGTWQCPHAQKGQDDVAALLGALASLRQHHADEGAILSVWLDVEEVRDDNEYLLWLQRLARAAPTELRFIIVDSVLTPSCAPLLQVEATRVLGEPCDLDMPGALTELAQAAHDDAPTAGSQFRLLLASLGATIAKHELTAALPLAEAALSLAMAQGWPHLAALVQLMLGGAYSALGMPLEAAKAYTEADRLGAESEKQAAAEDAGEEPRADGTEKVTSTPHGRQLRLHARFGQGATMIACAAWKQAAEVYLGAAPLAAALKDPRAELDCYRLASVSFERDGKLDKAWDVGMRGLKFAQSFDEATRTTSTLPFLGDHLLRMTEQHSAYGPYRTPMDKQFVAMLGPDWRPKPMAGAAA